MIGKIPLGAITVLASREAAKRVPNPDGARGRCREWLTQYVSKSSGGPVHMPPAMNTRDAFVTWAGVFLTIGILELFFNLVNGSMHWRGEASSVRFLMGSVC